MYSSCEPTHGHMQACTIVMLRRTYIAMVMLNSISVDYEVTTLVTSGIVIFWCCVSISCLLLWLDCPV